MLAGVGLTTMVDGAGFLQLTGEKFHDPMYRLLGEADRRLNLDLERRLFDDLLDLQCQSRALVDGASRIIVARIYNGWRSTLRQWVLHHQEHIRFGSLMQTGTETNVDKFDTF